MQANAEVFRAAHKAYKGKGATPDVIMLRAVGAIPIRKGDGPDEVRGVEDLFPGDVVRLRIERDESMQNAERVAILRAQGRFEDYDSGDPEHQLLIRRRKRQIQDRAAEAARKEEMRDPDYAERQEAKRKAEFDAAVAKAVAEEAARIRSEVAAKAAKDVDRKVEAAVAKALKAAAPAAQ